jgi:hypothetical protein
MTNPTPTESEIKRCIHVRLQAILDRAKSEYASAQIEYVKAKAAKDQYDYLIQNDFGMFDTYTPAVKQTEDEVTEAEKVVVYWTAVLDWADEKLIGPITDEAKRN